MKIDPSDPPPGFGEGVARTLVLIGARLVLIGATLVLIGATLVLIGAQVAAVAG